MNSNLKQFVLPLLALLVGIPIAQQPLLRRQEALEQELLQVRMALAERHPVQAPQAVPTPEPVQILAPAPTPEPAPAPAPIIQQPLTALDGVQLRYIEHADELIELADADLDLHVAGAGVPMPGALSNSGGLPPPEDPATAEELPKRLPPRVEKGGVLLRKGKTQVEPTVTYSHLSKNRVGLSGFSVFDVIFIGEIMSEEVDRDLVTSSLTVRHGITNRLQAEVQLPAQFQREEVLSGPLEERQQTTASRHGLNDINAGLFYQFAHETATMPNLIGHVRVKAPTGSAPRFGSGVWGTKIGVTALKSSDPVVLFSNLAYGANFAGQVNGVDINPGNSIEYSAGIAYALNYNIALNAGFEQVFVGPSLANDAEVAGSRLVVANFKTGMTMALTKQLSVDLAVENGLTEDSPDLSVSVSFPYTF